MPEIPDEVTQVESYNEIPQKVTEVSQETEEPETKPYLISFSKYNKNCCEIDILGKNKGNKALSILREIGTKVYTRADFQRNNIRNESVENSGDYKKLYSKIDEGIEIRELFLQSTGRIFYFDIEPKRILYVVAITENHYETNKIRRGT
ncbi:MAG: hypothetical protein WC447_01525 [Candidatus Paceibacterota bacterium]|jgi:hypothetical protein